MQITHDLAIGGLQQVVVNLCRTIDRSQFDISVLCLRELGEFTEEVKSIGVKVFYLPNKNSIADYFQFIEIAKLMRRERIEVIHTHNTQPFVDGTLGALLSGVPTIIHTDHARNFPDKVRYMFLEWLSSHFSYKIVGVSNHTSKNLITYEKISPRKVITITNGVDGSRFDKKVDRVEKRKSLGINSACPVIGLGVRLTKQKGIPYLLQAMPKVIQHFPEIVLLIVGDGPQREPLSAQAADLCIEHHVVFAGPRIDMPEILKVLDLYVLPSVWEGLPMVILEAMAAGCPVLATDVGGNATALQHKVNGSLIPSRNPEALSNEILYLLNNERVRARYIRNSLDIFHQKFSAKVMAKKYEKLYLRQA